MPPATRPTELEMVAVTGAKPSVTRVGKVIRVPDPTSELIAPAPSPASRINTISEAGTAATLPKCQRGLRFSRSRTLIRIGLPAKPNVSRSRRSRNRR